MPSLLTVRSLQVHGACRSHATLQPALSASDVGLVREKCSCCVMSGAVPMDLLPETKTVHCLRHGETEMNVWLAANVVAGSAYKDPLLYDTVLTANGQRQAAAAASVVPRLAPPPELIVCSPLTRALQTAELAFKGYDCPRIMTPLAAERLYHASDVGKVRSAIAPLWPAYDSSLLPEGVWWHTEQAGNPTAICPQADDSFEQRMQQLREFLSKRPEHSIALVAHWGVFASLTGRSLQNAEFLTITI